MAKILVTDGMDKGAKKQLIDLGHEVVEQFYEPAELEKEIRNYDAIIVRSATKIRTNIIDAAEGSKLKVIIRAGVGVDNIDVSYAESKGFIVRNTPNSTSDSVAEFALGSMFSLSRYIYISNVTMREGKWEKKSYKGTEIAGKTLGLIGFGRIARSLAKKAEALGMKVIYFDRTGEVEHDLNSTYANMDELLATSDYVSLHIPFDKETGAVIGEKELKKMKNTAFLIQTARGGTVDEESLLNALDNGEIAGAALDVFEEEPVKNERIYKHEKISLSPHVAGSTTEGQARIGDEIIDIINEYYN